MHVFDGRRHFRSDWAIHVAQMRAKVIERYEIMLPAPDVIADGKPLIARVDNNLWIVECPDCKSADIVWFDEGKPDRAHPQMCINCLNAAVGYKWRSITVPRAASRRGIESVLRARPLPHTRNWLPHETLENLIEENTDRDLPAAVSGPAPMLLTPDVER